MTETTALSTQPAPKAAASIEVGPGGLVPKSFDEFYRMAQVLSRADDMIPEHFRGKPEKIVVAMQRGAEVGLSPMQSLSHIAVIGGRATIWGDAIPALLQRAGHHVDVEYEGDGDSLVAVATLTRGDSGRRIVRRFGVADARRAGLLEKRGPWQQYTPRMCGMRARTWAARDGAADALMGLQVTEEVEDYGPDRARDVTPRTAPSRGGVVYREPEPDPEPVAPPRPEPEVDEVVEGEVVAPEPEVVPDAGIDGAALLEKLAGNILDWIGQETDPGGIDAILDQFAGKLDDMRRHLPERHAAIMAAAAAKRAV